MQRSTRNYQQGIPCQDPAGNRTTRRPPDHCKEMQTAVVWSCLPFIKSGQDHFARHSERGKKTRRTKEEVGRQHQEMDRPGVRRVPEGSEEQGKMEKTGCEVTVPKRPSRLRDRWEMRENSAITIPLYCVCLGRETYSLRQVSFQPKAKWLVSICKCQHHQNNCNFLW